MADRRREKAEREKSRASIWPGIAFRQDARQQYCLIRLTGIILCSGLTKRLLIDGIIAFKNTAVPIAGENRFYDGELLLA